MILMKLEFAQQLLEIYANGKLHEKQSGKRQVVP
jgi:hypothetical protein